MLPLTHPVIEEEERMEELELQQGEEETPNKESFRSLNSKLSSSKRSFSERKRSSRKDGRKLQRERIWKKHLRDKASAHSWKKAPNKFDRERSSRKDEMNERRSSYQAHPGKAPERNECEQNNY